MGTVAGAGSRPGCDSGRGEPGGTCDESARDRSVGATSGWRSGKPYGPCAGAARTTGARGTEISAGAGLRPKARACTRARTRARSEISTPNKIKFPRGGPPSRSSFRAGNGPVAPPDDVRGRTSHARPRRLSSGRARRAVVRSRATTRRPGRRCMPGAPSPGDHPHRAGRGSMSGSRPRTRLLPHEEGPDPARAGRASGRSGAGRGRRGPDHPRTRIRSSAAGSDLAGRDRVRSGPGATEVRRRRSLSGEVRRAPAASAGSRGR